MTPTGPDYRTDIRPDIDTAGNPCYVAEHPDLSGCVGYGQTPREATERLEVARRIYIESLLAADEDIPSASTATIWGMTWETAGLASQRRPVSVDPQEFRLLQTA